jgi:hypothetical protein
MGLIRVVPFKASRMFLKRLQEAIIRRGEKVVVNFGKAPPSF